MRVIAGKARSLKLKTIPGDATRPTTDRIKETLFNILQDSITGCSFLDLFAGSGAIGIEALSRGANCCDFVEKNPQAVSVIKENLRFTKLEGRVFRADVFSWIASVRRERPYDIIFMDPPYDNLFEKHALELLVTSKAVGPDTMIIFEASEYTPTDYLDETGYELVRIKDYKTNKHVFVKRKEV
ncbi:MAG: 16S rRNA (guanine(966)-N(2))-methyltransferase RsmD [Lachnospiraceae bacterium]|nr:16S rRNA (guanine(966)-N(2))-methyltransferase RsmD [Lachnospiraceae bacterium]